MGALRRFGAVAAAVVAVVATASCDSREQAAAPLPPPAPPPRWSAYPYCPGVTESSLVTTSSATSDVVTVHCAWTANGGAGGTPEDGPGTEADVVIYLREDGGRSADERAIDHFRLSGAAGPRGASLAVPGADEAGLTVDSRESVLAVVARSANAVAVVTLRVSREVAAESVGPLRDRLGPWATVMTDAVLEGLS